MIGNYVGRQFRKRLAFNAVGVMLLSTGNLFVACVAYFAIGFAGVVTGIVTMALYQACVPSEHIGRVQAIRYMISATVMLAAQLSAGVFKSALGVQGTYILASV